VLKLDRSFVAGLESDDDSDNRIVAAVVEMTRALGIGLIAEGVETEPQLASLRELGCRVAQGYYFARPAAADAVSVLLDARATSECPSPDAAVRGAIA
jgi:EAL domain-containing protein (putative c-di-GMP-specific phosphodiesterase class I)